VRQAVREAAPDEPPPVVLTLDEYVAAELTVERSILRLLGWFSTIAALLSIIGTYGIAARAVARLTKEIAVRLALGAPNRLIVQLVARSALIPTTAGIVVGPGPVRRLPPTLLLSVALASSWVGGASCGDHPSGRQPAG
jgi:putative ABC transport system permease protein